jgi:Mlc titration factor MtfA (ptsG expression regulator)
VTEFLVVLLAGAAIVGLAMFVGRSERFLALLARLGGRSLRAGLAGGRRELLLAEPFPAAWERILRHNLGLYSHLTPAEQERLRKIVQVLAVEKEWTPCNGLEMTDEVRVTIAGAAGVLLLAREHAYYETVQSILVYPTTFEMPAERAGAGGVVLQERHSLLGQAWYRGPVLLAWDEARRDCRQPLSGRNVVYHEFAHQLAFEGASPAAGREGQEQLERFAAVMQAEYEALVKASAQGRATLIDSYGASNPNEFFAVATECFFGRPEAMQRSHPALYRVLGEFYNQDPATRFHRGQREE